MNDRRFSLELARSWEDDTLSVVLLTEDDQGQVKWVADALFEGSATTQEVTQWLVRKLSPELRMRLR